MQVPRTFFFIIICSYAVLLGGCNSPARRAAPCAREPNAQVESRIRERFAVLINGDVERRHKDNIAEAYSTLRALGFTREHIFVLSPRDSRKQIAAPALRLRPSYGSFKRTMDNIAPLVRRGDLLLIYGTGHGDLTDKDEAFLALGSRDGIWPDELRDSIERLPADTVVVMDQCFSGAFADAFQGTKARAIAIATVDGKHETDCYYFASAFWDSFLHPERADHNRDGKTSVREAYEVAIEAHRKGLKDDPEVAADGCFRSFNGLDDALLN